MLRFDHFTLVKKVLTEEQSKKFKSIISENGKHKPGPFEGKREGPPPRDDFPPCLLYTSPSPRDRTRSRMPSSA